MAQAAEAHLAAADTAVAAKAALGEQAQAGAKAAMEAAAESSQAPWVEEKLLRPTPSFSVASCLLEGGLPWQSHLKMGR